MIFYMDQIASQIIHAKSDMFIIRNTNYSTVTVLLWLLKTKYIPIWKYTKNLRL